MYLIIWVRSKYTKRNYQRDKDNRENKIRKQQKYFEINEENNELSVKEEWKEKMYKFINLPSIYNSTKKDIEKILKVKLNNRLI